MNMKQMRALIEAGFTDEQICAIAKIGKPDQGKKDPGKPDQGKPDQGKKDPGQGDEFRDQLSALAKSVEGLQKAFQVNNILNDKQPQEGGDDAEDILAAMLNMELEEE